MSNNISEIGSEFWIECNPKILHSERDGVYCLSGRTAIDLILQDILRIKRVKSVAMPAWCCDSMIAPFIAHGINVLLYDYGQTDITNNADIFYLTNYFGYEDTLPVQTVRKIKEQRSIILYDRTHSFLMDDGSYQELADYSFASIRKWMGVIDGAVVVGLLKKPALKGCPYVPIKEVAMKEKYRYLMGEVSVKKDEFLTSFGEFGHRLASDFCNYEMDILSYTLYKQEDLTKMRQQRRWNAAYIHENMEGVRFMFDFNNKSVPLFVPILFESKEKRDYVRKKLIEKQIYCPVHWPKPAIIPKGYKVNDIVDRELSLICDQRYGLSQIKREIETINKLI